MSRLTGPVWDACDELEFEDLATAYGVNMILNRQESFMVNTTWTDRIQAMRYKQKSRHHAT